MEFVILVSIIIEPLHTPITNNLTMFIRAIPLYPTISMFQLLINQKAKTITFSLNISILLSLSLNLFRIQCELDGFGRSYKWRNYTQTTLYFTC